MSRRKTTPREAPARDRRYDALVVRASELVAAARRRLRFGPQQDAGLDRAATRCHEAIAELQGWEAGR